MPQRKISFRRRFIACHFWRSFLFCRFISQPSHGKCRRYSRLLAPFGFSKITLLIAAGTLRTSIGRMPCWGPSSRWSSSQLFPSFSPSFLFAAPCRHTGREINYDRIMGDVFFPLQHFSTAQIIGLIGGHFGSPDWFFWRHDRHHRRFGRRLHRYQNGHAVAATVAIPKSLH